jgi:type IV pilus assembly protein PilB
MLNQINTEEINISTLEDPIEYVIPGINQSQIEDSTTSDTTAKNYTYAKGMKALLRQDPDVILV